MATRAFRLAMQSPLHVGRAGVGFEETQAYIPSDTLFSALVITWLEMGEPEAVEGLRESFEENPPLLLTSAFPILGHVMLLPRPRLEPTGQQGGDSSSRKKFKKVQWVSHTLFQQILQGQGGPEPLWQSGVTIQDGQVLVSADEARQIAGALDKPALVSTIKPGEAADLHGWQEAKAPHVTVDRNSNASTIYHVGRVHFAQGCGLWFMAKGKDTWLDRTAGALDLLQDSGIGGQRSRGHGRFYLNEMGVPPQLERATGNYQVLLSRLAPKKTEMELLRQPHSRYDLVAVGGYSVYPGREAVIRQQVRLLSEGSIIGGSERPPGQLVDVKPEIVRHPIYRYGFGYGVPIVLPEGGVV